MAAGEGGTVLLRRPVTMRWLAPLGWVLLVAAVAGVAWWVIDHGRSDAGATQRLAVAERAVLLEAGEVVLAEAPVAQRLWWDFFRSTHGVLAATDRRLLFVGIPPEPLLHRAAGPFEVVDASFRFAGAVGVREATTRSRGLRVRLASGTQVVGLEATAAAAPAMRAVLDTMRARRDQLRAAAEAERRAVEATSAASRRATYHLVQPGEALESIARRYGTTTDSLLAWNALGASRIVAGQRLLVRPGQAP
ncbi:MAG: LysM peptidoglycan-binding domain-containing protein [Gemmatimonadetes bacterium]|nr:LysM peptidoglycan-binding domain-containing protein [Gemmatimonadota bacterium]